MFRKILILAFFMCFTAINGFSSGSGENGNKEDIEKIITDIDNLKKTQDDTANKLKEMDKKIVDLKPSPQPPIDPVRSGEKPNNDKFIPLTWEIAVEFEKDLDKLDFYFSKDINLMLKAQKNNNGEVKDGKIVDNNANNLSEEKLVISNSAPVKAVKFSLNPKNKANIDIFFSAQSVWLKFIRNTKDYFQLDSAIKNTKDYAFDEEVLLYVYDERNPENQIPAQKPGTPLTQADNGVSSVNRPQIPEYIMLISGQPYPYLTEGAVVEYLSGNSRGVARRDIEAIVRHYRNEAKTENINHDIAIAQMCYATQSLSNKTLFKNMNYAGLIKDGAVWNGKSWNGKFPGSQIGVRAHIQHLKGYASTAPLNEKTVDPRFYLLANRRGKGDSLHKLCSFWVVKDPAGYEDNLRKILEDLYKYQENYNKIKGF